MPIRLHLPFLSSSSPEVIIVGGGPAGLRAAEAATQGGAQVTLYDAKRSVGRKLLVAGKSGLNLTNDEPFEQFVGRYEGAQFPRSWWRSVLHGCDSGTLRAWAEGLGVETFASSGGKVFPSSMKAAPLLRRWLHVLRNSGVRFMMNHRFREFGKDPTTLTFTSPAGGVSVRADAVVLALGGGSWPSTGSTGAWVQPLRDRGVAVTSLHPANCGWEVAWPQALLDEAIGLPLKNITASAAGQRYHGELVITRYGLEGTPIYHLGPTLRAMESPTLQLDLKPDFPEKEIVQRLGSISSNYVREARRRLRLSEAAAALLRRLPDLGPWRSTATLAAAIKACPIHLTGPRPLEEAISSAGGVCWRELDESLMIRALPGVFLAGEMIDWEAPTGGYLIQGCFTMGSHAGSAAARWARARQATP